MSISSNYKPIDGSSPMQELIFLSIGSMAYNDSSSITVFRPYASLQEAVEDFPDLPTLIWSSQTSDIQDFFAHMYDHIKADNSVAMRQKNLHDVAADLPLDPKVIFYAEGVCTFYFLIPHSRGALGFAMTKLLTEAERKTFDNIRFKK